MNGCFIKGDAQRPNKLTKRCSTQLAIKEMPVRNTMTYHHVPIGMAEIKMVLTKGWQGC